MGHLCKCLADVFQMPHHRQYVAVRHNFKQKPTETAKPKIDSLTIEN
jgi:hypothetical protein